MIDKIFEIVDHLNVGVELITAQTERNEIANLNLMAGRKAKGATAYNAALGYFTAGMKLLAIDSWQSQYNLTLNLYIEAVETAYVTTDFEQMERWAAVVLQQAKTVLDKVKVFEVKIQTRVAQVKQLEAIQIGLQALNLLGVNIPESPTELEIQQRLEETATALRGKNIDDLMNLPLMTDTNKLAAMRILSSMLAAAYIAAPKLWPLINCEQVNLSIRYGNASFSTLAYASYGTFLIATLHGIDLGYQFGQLALNLVERLNAKELRCKTFFVVATFVKHWKAHVNETFSLFMEAYSSGLENGDLEYTSFAVIDKSLYSYFKGSELTELEREMVSFSNFLAQIKQEMSWNYHQMFRQAVLNLIGQAENPCCLLGEACNEEKMLPLYLEANSRSGLHFFYTHKLILCYLFGEFSQAMENATQAEQYIDGAFGMLSVPVLYFYDSLARLAVYSSVPSEQEKLLLKVTSNQDLMKTWAHHAPMNHLHKFYLVEAEKARVLGQIVEAIDFYEGAIKAARENKYLQEEALAYELAAKFYLARGMEEFAQLYMLKAHYSYICWGAKAKVKDLEQKYPQFFTKRSAIPPKTTTTTSSTDSKTSAEFDLTSVIKASQTLSGEIMLETLLGKMMKLVIENAGAQTGYLILEKNGQWVIEASGTIASDEVQILHSVPIETVSGSSDTPMVANAIVNYVVRTQESVVLNDATHEGNFTRAPYILRQQPKSVLCAPLINQGKLIGILYLENNLTTGAFTPDRLEVLNVLSSQAAISIENAKLYAEVRESEAKLMQFLEALPVGVSVHDATGRVSYANPTSDRLMGKGVISEATPEQLSQVYQVYIEGTEQLYPTEQLPTLRALKGESVTVEDIEVHQEGKIVPLEVRSIPVCDDQGNIIYAINAFQDITERKQAQKVLADYNRTLEQQVQERTLELKKEIVERKRAEEAANVANHAKSTFLANMSHELRSPLNAILGFSQLMSRTPTLTPEDKENLRIIARSGEHLLTLINQVLDLSKIEAGRITLNATSFDLYQLLDDLEDMFQLKADNKQLQLLFELAPNVPRYMQTDEVKLR
ncbi:MAG TPA: PAS domain S-box protein, partial [Cyanobacteria bacterium UBA8543]|nr:PAS domain S-box protein [Cyanobacteria bacterium UBA8543]